MNLESQKCLADNACFGQCMETQEEKKKDTCSIPWKFCHKILILIWSYTGNRSAHTVGSSAQFGSRRNNQQLEQMITRAYKMNFNSSLNMNRHIWMLLHTLPQKWLWLNHNTKNASMLQGDQIQGKKSRVPLPQAHFAIRGLPWTHISYNLKT